MLRLTAMVLALVAGLGLAGLVAEDLAPCGVGIHPGLHLSAWVETFLVARHLDDERRA